jgi:organic radical activating enzyme
MSGTLEEYGLSNLTFADNNEQNLNKVKTLLNSTGCGFCLAKFRQVTLHLGTGMTHACHHPSPHKIELDEIKNNPAALFNTKVLKSARKQMLNGERPDECDYCWRVEDNNGVSDRFYKSLEPWALPDHDSITQLTGDEDIYPRYLEVSFNNACNLQCVYCGPEFSSKWVEDLKEKGPIVLFKDHKTKEQWAQGWQDLNNLTYRNADNPYVTAFWEWFVEAYKHLYHYRITGGEPLMNKETFKSMDWFIENPNPNLEFSINSNLSVPEKLWKTFIEKLKLLKENNRVKKITIYTSVEGWGNRAEYARHHLNFDLFKQRVEELAELGNVRCVIMSTFNILSISSFQDLLEWVLDLKRKYNPNNSSQHVETSTGFQLSDYSLTDRKINNPDHSFTIGIDIPYLRHPEYLDIQYCSHDLVEKFLLPAMEFMSKNVSNPSWTDHQGFEPYEFEKFKRIISHRLYFNRKNRPEREAGHDIIKHRAMFFEFIEDIDKRRGSDFLTVYPEYNDFYQIAKKCREEYLTNGSIN